MSTPSSVLADFWDFFTPGDSVEMAALRAQGIDPATNLPVSAIDAARLDAMGIDTRDPNAMAKFVSSVEQQAGDFYQAGYNSAFSSNGGVSFIPFAPAVGGDSAAIESASNAILSAFTGGSKGSSGPSGSLSGAFVILLVVAGLVLILWAVN